MKSKIIMRFQLWDLEREVKFYKSKIKFLRQIIKHIKQAK